MIFEAFYELQPSDINRARIKCFGRTWSVTDFLGRVLPLDVGKRVYLRSGVLQVENEEQRRRRVRRARNELAEKAKQSAQRKQEIAAERRGTRRATSDE